MKMYELSNEWQALQKQLEDAGGELTTDLELSLGRVQGSLEAKVRGIIALSREAKARAAAYGEEKARFAHKEKVELNAVDRLEGYLLNCLQGANLPSIKTDIGSATVRQASRPAISCEPNKLPAEYAKVETKLDGTKAYDAFRAGTLPPVFAVNFTTFVQIR